MAVLPGSETGHVRRHGEALAGRIQRVRAWAARHAFVSAWTIFAAILSAVFIWSGQAVPAAVTSGIALGLAISVAAYLFTPIPRPISREGAILRLPGFRTLARLRHWANPFYVEVVKLRSPYRPSYCESELASELLRFPWFPVAPVHNFAGWIDQRSFVMKRVTLWANGMRPTASGELDDAGPGTLITLRVAVPAPGAYFVVIFLFLLLLLGAIAIVGGWGTPGGKVAALIAGLFALFVFGFFAIAGSPVPGPLVSFFLTPQSEADRYVAFFSEVLGAEVISRD